MLTNKALRHLEGSTGLWGPRGGGSCSWQGLQGRHSSGEVAGGAAAPYRRAPRRARVCASQTDRPCHLQCRAGEAYELFQMFGELPSVPSPAQAQLRLNALRVGQMATLGPWGGRLQAWEGSPGSC